MSFGRKAGMPNVIPSRSSLPESLPAAHQLYFLPRRSRVTAVTLRRTLRACTRTRDRCPVTAAMVIDVPDDANRGDDGV